MRIGRLLEAIAAFVRLESAGVKEMRSAMWKYDLETARSIRYPIEKEELRSIVRGAIGKEIWSAGTPFVAAALVMCATIAFVRSRNLRFRWVVKEAVLASLKVLQAAVFLGAVLSWFQPPFGFPRIVLDTILAPLYERDNTHRAK